MKVKVESEKVGLKLNIQKMKIMASGPITSWEIDGETVSDFIFLGSKITADGDHSLWLCGSQQTGKFWKRWEYQNTLPASWETCMQVKKQQLEQDMEQRTGSKLGKENFVLLKSLVLLIRLYIVTLPI